MDRYVAEMPTRFFNGPVNITNAYIRVKGVDGGELGSGA